MPNKPVTLYLDHSAPPPVVPVSLGDSDWTFQFTVMYNGNVYAPTVNKVIMTGHKPDGNVVAFAGSKSGNVFNVTPASVQLTAVAGIVACELRLIANNGRSVGTGNFLLQVEEGPEGTVTVASSSSLSAYTTILNQLQQIMSQASTIPSDIAGYISDWLEAHISGGQGVAVDDTLTVQGAAADAKKTGDRLDAMESAQNLGVMPAEGSINAALDSSGAVAASSRTVSYYVRCKPNTTYRLVVDLDAVEANGAGHFIGVFSALPAVGSATALFSYTTQVPPEITEITTNENAAYLLYGHGLWLTDEHLRVLGPDESGKTIGERVRDLENAKIETDTTLTVEGAAADAAAVGAALNRRIDYRVANAITALLLDAVYNGAGHSAHKELLQAWLLQFDTIPALSLTLSADSAELTEAGQTLQLVATVTPAETTDTVVWSSSNPEAASVDQTGLVTCVDPTKTAYITATAGSATAICAVNSESGSVNYVAVGDPHIEGTWFYPAQSNGGFIKTPQAFSPGSNSWKIQTELVWNAYAGNNENQDFFGAVDGSNNVKSPRSIFLQSFNKRLLTYMSSDGSTWGMMTGGTGDAFDLNTGTAYLLEASYSNGTYTLRASTDDGATWPLTWSKAVSGQVAGGNALQFGAIRNAKVFDGRINLAKTKIYINNALWWSAL